MHFARRLVPFWGGAPWGVVPYCLAIEWAYSGEHEPGRDGHRCNRHSHGDNVSHGMMQGGRRASIQ
eukprot:scaffold6148_cov20-Tisochrysis_lutea.AAC.1